MVVLVQGNQELYKQSRSGSVMVVGLWTVEPAVHWDSSKGGKPTFAEEAVAIDLISDRLLTAPPLLLCRVTMRAIMLPTPQVCGDGADRRPSRLSKEGC